MSSEPPEFNNLQPKETKQEPVRLFVMDEQLSDPIRTEQAALPAPVVNLPGGGGEFGRA